jgi:hypothetical protein
MITKELCLEALRRDAFALEYVPPHLVTEELCIEAVKECGDVLVDYIPASFKTWKVYLEAAKSGLGFLNIDSIPQQFRTEALCLAAIENSGYALESVPDKLKSKMPLALELCEMAVKKQGKAIKYVKAAFLSSELCRVAVNQNGDAILGSPKRLRTAELWESAIGKSGYMLKYLPAELMTAELCRRALENCGYALEFVPKKFQTKELFFIAVRQDSRALKFVDFEKLGRNEYTEICREAFKNAAKIGV